mgnify:CR=1 FL=1
MSDSSEALVQRILNLSEAIVNVVQISVPAEWLTSGLTLAQLRVLLVLHLQGDSRMSAIASALGIALPTATAIVDKLVRKGLVERETDASDRRLVLCTLSETAKNLLNKLWLSGKFQMESLLDGLTPEQLEKAAEVAQVIFDNVSRKINGRRGDGTL